MAQVGQDPIIPGPTYYTEDKPASFMTLLESIGDPKSLVLGRVEFQKRARQVAGPLACSCITQLAAWREGYYRWSLLQPNHASDSRSSSDQLSNFEGRFTTDVSCSSCITSLCIDDTRRNLNGLGRILH